MALFPEALESSVTEPSTENVVVEEEGSAREEKWARLRQIEQEILETIRNPHKPRVRGGSLRVAAQQYANNQP